MTKEIMHNIYELNQEELREFIKGMLSEKNIPYVEYDGNIYSFRFKNKVAFVSHMDTVAKSDNEYHKPVFEANGILFKRNAILGADDRAGVNCILNHIDDINFIFTRDEEIGRLGAESLKNNNDFVNAINEYNVIGFIEMDRKNNNDILGAVHGYCDQDFHDAVASVLVSGVDVKGVCTDIDSFIKIRAGVNLSCGYHSPHSPDEYLDIESWLKLNNAIPELNNISGEFSLPKPKYTYKTYVHTYGKNKYCGYNAYVYNDYVLPSSLTDSKMKDVEHDVTYANTHRIEGYNYPEYTKDGDIINLIKDSQGYMTCAYCGEVIKKGERYHVVEDSFAHDSCLLDYEKILYGIKPLKNIEVNDGKPNKADK